MPSDWLSQLEARLERLEHVAAAPELQTDAFLTAVRNAVAVVAVGAPAEIWLVSESDRANREASSAADPAEPAIRRLNADGSTTPAANDLRQQVAGFLRDESTAAFTTERSDLLLFAASVTSAVRCVLSVPCERLLVPSESATQTCQNIATVSAAFLARYLLQHSQAGHRSHAVLLQIAQRIASCSSTSELASTVAQELAVLLPAGRVTVLRKNRTGLQLLAVSGVQQPNRDSETCRALVEVAEQLNDDKWLSLSSATEQISVAQVLQSQGMTELRVVRTSDEVGSAAAVVLLESGQPEDRVRLDDRFVHQLVATIEPAFRQALRTEQSWVRTLLTGRRWMQWTLLAATVAFLAFWPTKFEVEVDGQITSTNYRRIFAPDEGVVQQVSFQHRQRVHNGQPLLQMDNADLQLELRRIEGDIQTTTAELSAVLAERLNADDPKLSALERRLETKLESLQQQKRLIDQRSMLLTVTAPFAGRIFRHHPQQTLLARPVQRGQLLLELVPDDGKWQLELSVPDHLEPYVRQSMQRGDAGPPVRYLIRSAPDRERNTRLDEIDDVLQLHEGQAICRATADLSDAADADFRPGTSVIARIDCGTRPVGFVWFRELIHYWRTIRFAWL